MCNWVKGKQQGYSIEMKANGETWQGNQINGKYFGKCKITFANKDTYNGDYDIEHQKHGKGVEIKKNGDKYDGKWLNDKYDGEGIMTLANKDTYAGAFSEGQKHG